MKLFMVTAVGRIMMLSWAYNTAGVKLKKPSMRTKHLTPALSPFCSADSAKRGEGETLPASWRIMPSVTYPFQIRDSVNMHPQPLPDAENYHSFARFRNCFPMAALRRIA